MSHSTVVRISGSHTSGTSESGRDNGVLHKIRWIITDSGSGFFGGFERLLVVLILVFHAMLSFSNQKQIHTRLSSFFKNGFCPFATPSYSRRHSLYNTYVWSPPTKFSFNNSLTGGRVTKNFRRVGQNLLAEFGNTLSSDYGIMNS